MCLAKQIKIQAGDNETARLVAHTILGAVVAELQGNSELYKLPKPVKWYVDNGYIKEVIK